MALTSFGFLVFFAATLALYYLVPRRFRWWVLLAASQGFFALAGGWQMLVLLWFGVAVTYAGARLVERADTDGKKRLIAGVTVALALLELVLLKYVPNVFSGAAGLFSLQIGGRALSLIVPLGISYYTLSIVGYVIDVYRGVCPAERNVLRHALFTAYYPQVISGPVTRYGAMAPQLFGGAPFSYRNVTFGMERMLFGYFKKMVIADNLALVVDHVFMNADAFGGVFYLFAVVLYAVQIYCDFSGCMDIVLGASEAYGVVLPENFDAPFFSRTIPEFWRRWHITLGLWFKDYLLYPLLKSAPMQAVGAWSKRVFGKKRGKNVPTYLGLLLVWFCLGLWHGGTLKFLVASGLIPACYLILSSLFSPAIERATKRLGIRTYCLSFRLFQYLRTFLLVCVIFLFVRADRCQTALFMLRGMFAASPVALGEGVSRMFSVFGGKTLAVLAYAVAVLAAVEIWHVKGVHVRERLARQNLPARWAVLLVLLFSVLLFGAYGAAFNAADFIYGGF